MAQNHKLDPHGPKFFSELPGAPDTKGGPGGTILDAAIADAIVSLGPQEVIDSRGLVETYVCMCVPFLWGKLVKIMVHLQLEPYRSKKNIPTVDGRS